MVKTCIPELKKAIEESMKAVASYKDRPGLLECEEYVYDEMQHELLVKLQAEISKAKALMKKRKGWRWKMFMECIKSPGHIIISLMALCKRRKK